MGWSGQEDGMDVMKEIIQKEIQSISSLEERVIFKNLMEGVFLSLYDTNREMYEGLERRIKEELKNKKNRPPSSRLSGCKEIKKEYYSSFSATLTESGILNRIGIFLAVCLCIIIACIASM